MRGNGKIDCNWHEKCAKMDFKMTTKHLNLPLTLVIVREPVCPTYYSISRDFEWILGNNQIRLQGKMVIRPRNHPLPWTRKLLAIEIEFMKSWSLWRTYKKCRVNIKCIYSATIKIHRHTCVFFSCEDTRSAEISHYTDRNPISARPDVVIWIQSKEFHVVPRWEAMAHPLSLFTICQVVSKGLCLCDIAPQSNTHSHTPGPAVIS